MEISRLFEHVLLFLSTCLHLYLYACASVLACCEHRKRGSVRPEEFHARLEQGRAAMQQRMDKFDRRFGLDKMGRSRPLSYQSLPAFSARLRVPRIIPQPDTRLPPRPPHNHCT